MLRNFIRNINYLFKNSLYDVRERDISFLTDKILEDCSYEYDLKLPYFKSINVLSKEESLKLFMSNPKSFVRVGDGEINLIKGISQPFQEYDEELAHILRLMLNQKTRDNIYICINHAYFSPQFKYEDYRYRQYIRRYGYEYRHFLLDECNLENKYLDAGMTGYPLADMQKKHDDAAFFFNQWKKILKDRDLVIVTGKGIWDNYSYDIFEEANSKRFIYGLPRHAWREHKKIMDEIIQVARKDDIIVFALGMAGKAMIYELTEMGYEAWDLGHLNKYYNAFKSGFVYSEKNRAEFYKPD